MNLISFLTLIAIFILLIFSQASAVLCAESAADQLYENAFRLIVEGDYAEAYERLGEIISLYPNTTYARMAEDRRWRLEELNLPDIGRTSVDQSGRMESVVFGTLYSTWLGIGSARLADADSEKSAAAGMMIGAPLGLLTSIALTRNAELSHGQAALLNFGGYWGTWQGFGLSILLDNNDDEKTMIGGAMAGGIAGLITTATLTRRINPTWGDASIINYGGIWGTCIGLLGGLVADVDDSDNLLSLALAGGNIGVAATAAISPKLDLSFTQASLINLSGIVGTIVSGGILIIVQPDNERAVWSTLLAGGVLGLAGGYGVFGIKPVSMAQMTGSGKPVWGIGGRQYRAHPGDIQANLLSIQF